MKEDMLNIYFNMTLEEYIKTLQEYAKNNPETLQLDVITSSDDEGNSYNNIYFEPSKGCFERQDKSFDIIDEDNNEDINAVCVN